MAIERQVPEASITSYGSVGGTVTGSLHIFESGQKGQRGYCKVAVDCGLFQGKGDLAEMYREKARGDEVIDKISEGNPSFLLTHSHIDHIGFLPLLFRYGYTPLVYTTKETKKIIEKNLTRSAKAQQRGLFVNDFFFEPEDVKKTLSYIQTVEPFEEIPITRDKKIKAIFCPNGHIPGSSSILLKDLSSGKNVLFTGDIGRPKQLVTGGYDRFAPKYPQDPIHAVVTESTCYTDTPIPFEKRIDSFQKEIMSAFERGNSVLMPCIQHRFMENREIIHNSQKEGKLPKDIDFFLDGPALDDIDDIYKDFTPDYLTKRYGDNPLFYSTENSQSRFNLDNFYTIKTHQESLAFAGNLSKRHKKTIIFTSGGMGEDGRINNYLRTGFVSRELYSLIFSCFLVGGTIGADLLNEQNQPGYRGARVVKLEGGSSHATGPEEIFGYLKRYNLEDLENVIIVHGSDTSRKSMEVGIRQTDFGKYVNIELPEIGKRVNLV